MSRPLAVFLHSTSYDRLYQAASLLLTAAGMGRPCMLFLFYGALATYVAGEWDDARSGDGEPDAEWTKRLTRGFELSDTPTPSQVLEMARSAEGGVDVYACSASMRLLGLEPATVRGKVREVVGLATMLEMAQDAQTLYI
jgi:peroxiredoxin family protein